MSGILDIYSKLKAARLNLNANTVTYFIGVCLSRLGLNTILISVIVIMLHADWYLEKRKI